MICLNPKSKEKWQLSASRKASADDKFDPSEFWLWQWPQFMCLPPRRGSNLFSSAAGSAHSGSNLTTNPSQEPPASLTGSGAGSRSAQSGDDMTGRWDTVDSYVLLVWWTPFNFGFLIEVMWIIIWFGGIYKLDLTTFLDDFCGPIIYC